MTVLVHECKYTTLLDFLTAPTLTPIQKLAGLHLYHNRSNPLTGAEKWELIGLTVHQWRRNIIPLLKDAHVGYTSFLKGTSKLYHSSYINLGHYIYAPCHPSTRLVLVYMQARNNLRGWKFWKQDILKMLGLTEHAWRYHIAPDLQKLGYLSYSKYGVAQFSVPSCAKTTSIHTKLRIMNNNLSEERTKLSTGRRKYTFQPISLYEELRRLAGSMGIFGAKLWVLVKKFTIEKVLIAMRRLKHYIGDGAINSWMGWVWKVCKRMEEKDRELEKNHPVSAIPNYEETQAMIQAWNNPPKIVRSPEEEAIAKREAEEGYAKFLAFLKKP